VSLPLSADRNLLFGILAVQSGFCTGPQLVEAMNAWTLAKDRPLGDVLLQRGFLKSDEFDLLSALVAKQLAKHGGDVDKSIAALSPSLGLAAELHRVRDSDVQHTLASIASSNDPDRTRAASVDSSGDAVRYRILRPHARGGLGEVFVARDEELGREVALKEIQPTHADDPNSRGRFVREAEVTGGLEHPGIVAVYGLGSYSDGRPFYAMRFIQGDSLKEAIDRFHRSGKPDFTGTEFRQLLGRFVDVCQAIAYAHSRGVLHRDLKPGNIMLGKFGETLVVDWGLAKVVGSKEGSTVGRSVEVSSDSSATPTMHGQAIGTPAFMSPEQATGNLNELGPATDVYSLGATLYTLLAKRAPIEAANVGEALRKAERGEWTPLLSVNPAIPAALATVCGKAMAARPTDRYATADALAADVERYLADEPVSVHRDGALVGLRKRPAATAGAAVAVLVGLAASVVGFVVVGGKNVELADANLQLGQATLKAQENEQTALRAKAVAENERTRASEAEAVAVAVRNFLQNDLLRQASAWETFSAKNLKPGQRHDPTVRELLDAAADEIAGEKLERKFPKLPLAQAEILETLADACIALGNDAAAVGHQKRACEVLQKAYGLKHSATLTARIRLAAGHLQNGSVGPTVSEAVAVAEACAELLAPNAQGEPTPEGVGTVKRFFDALNAIWASARIRLTSPISMSGLDSPLVVLRMTQGMLTLHRLKPLMIKTFGEDDPGTLLVRQLAAVGLEIVGSKKEAVLEAEKIVAAAEKRFGPDDFRLVPLYLNLSRMYSFEGRNREQLTTAEKAHRICLKIPTIGANHLHTAQALRNLGAGRYNNKQYKTATADFLQALNVYRVRLGEAHPETISTHWDVGRALMDQNRNAEAVPHLEQVRKAFAAEDPTGERALISTHVLGDAMAAAGRRAEGIALLREVLPPHRKRFGDAHRETLLVRFNLAMYEAEAGDRTALDRALAALQDAEKHLKDGPGSHKREDGLFNLRDRIVTAYNDAGIPAKALPLAEKHATEAAKKFGGEHRRTKEARDLLTETQDLAAGRKPSKPPKAAPKKPDPKAKS
jgi:tetratricopeptide (TPR) repeat protein/tRNA A-37 threonylcarbamoyl transferase component Bud32